MKKIEYIIIKLKTLFPNPVINLDYKDPFCLLIAVLLSAQCTDKKVNEIAPILFNLADNPYKMSKLSLQKIENIIYSCGLYVKKSQSILNLSKIILKEYNGKIPQTLKELESLPLVGRKTASIIMAQIFNKKTFPVDTHVKRLSQRWKISKSSNVIKIEEDLKKAFPEYLWYDIHLQMIQYGRKYCTAKKHSLDFCEICQYIENSYF